MPYSAPNHNEDGGQYRGGFILQNEEDGSSAIVNFEIQVEGVGTGPGYDSAFQEMVDLMSTISGATFFSASKSWGIGRTVTPTPAE